MLFGGTQHCRSSSTSDLTCACQRSPDLKRWLFLPRMPGLVLRKLGRGWWWQPQKLPPILGCGRRAPRQKPCVMAYSRAAWDPESQIYWAGPNHFHHSLRCRLDWHKERGASKKKSCSGYCCGKQINLPYDICTYPEKLLRGGRGKNQNRLLIISPLKRHMHRSSCWNHLE